MAAVTHGAAGAGSGPADIGMTGTIWNATNQGQGPAGADLVNDLLLVQSSERLLAWAEELTQTHALWIKERDAFLASHQARLLEAGHQQAAVQAWLAPLPSLLQATHDKHMEALGCSLADAKRALSKEQEQANRDLEYLEEAMLRRQRLARCRLARKEEFLQVKAAQLARAAEQRAQDERARLERERARAERRRADLELERMRLQAALDKDRALFRPPRAEAGTQTAVTGAVAATASAAGAVVKDISASSESYSSDNYSDDDEFESISRESEEDDESDLDPSEGASGDTPVHQGPGRDRATAARARGELSSSISSSIHSSLGSFSHRTSSSVDHQTARSDKQSSRDHESFSGSSELSRAPADQRAHRQAAAESVASVESSVSEEIAGSIASSIRSIDSA